MCPLVPRGVVSPTVSLDYDVIIECAVYLNNARRHSNCCGELCFMRSLQYCAGPLFLELQIQPSCTLCCGKGFVHVRKSAVLTWQHAKQVDDQYSRWHLEGRHSLCCLTLAERLSQTRHGATVALSVCLRHSTCHDAVRYGLQGLIIISTCHDTRHRGLG
jgi:hypothetical protein